MGSTLRGADIVARSLVRAGIDRIFTLSGNHIMSVFDASLDANLPLVHVRHEAAAVHMADAWARLTGQVGVALLTGGPGHANGVSALYTALASESPVVLLSGHAPLDQLGTGAFQEMRQADMAAPVTKASWTVASVADLARDVAKALRIAASGRPGPVHLSLPTDVLDAVVAEADVLLPAAEQFGPIPQPLPPALANDVISTLLRARQPLILTGPYAGSAKARDAVAALRAVTGIPVVTMESPRGVNDPSLGAFAEVLGRADCVLLLGKQPDFTLGFARPPVLRSDCRLIQIDPDPSIVARLSLIANQFETLPRMLVADTLPSLSCLLQAASEVHPAADWRQEVDQAISYRPADWNQRRSTEGQPLHPVELCRAVSALLAADPRSVLVSDGGEFGQWAQACLSSTKRVINGPAGAIGSALSFALAARLAAPEAPVIALLGDGTIGFHLAEFDTAVRYGLPFVAIVGNDACWNAEHQIQLRNYGAERLVGCELLPARYDQVAEALGGHGEYVTQAEDLPAALERALHSGRPACVNVIIERVPAPTIRRSQAARAKMVATH
jgi:acetolactate synthase-1/2/3 large subunit